MERVRVWNAPPKFPKNYHYHRRIIDGAAKQLGIKRHEDWYKFSLTDMKEPQARFIRAHYNGSLFTTLRTVYPEFVWECWLFKKIPNGFWKEEENRAQYFKWLYESLKIENEEDWQGVTTANIKKLGGKGFLAYYNHSIFNLLKSFYPDKELHPWIDINTPKKFWQSQQNQKKYFNWLSKKLHIKKPEDWYRITSAHVGSFGGSHLLTTYHNGSISQALQSIYPELDLFPWFNTVTEKEWFLSPVNRRKYFDWLEVQLGINTKEDWYSVRITDIKHGSLMMKQLFENNLAIALQSVYPEFQWNVNKFHSHKMRLVWDKLATSLGITVSDDWYQVSSGAIKTAGGINILDDYDGSLISALQTIYPEFSWRPWLLKYTPRNFMDSKENQREYFDWIADIFGIHTQDEWYDLLMEDLRAVPGSSFIGTFWDTLETVYPQFEWYPWLFVHTAPIWQLPQMQKKAMDWFAYNHGIEESSHWCEFMNENFLDEGLLPLLQQYNASILQTCQAVYPQFQWHPWLFQKCPQKFWQDPSNHRKFLDWFAEEHGIGSPEQWFNVRYEAVAQKGGAHMIVNYYGFSLLKALQNVYKEVDWLSIGLNIPPEKRAMQFEEFSDGHLKLCKALQTVLSEKVRVLTNYKHPNLFHNSSKPMELDVYIPSLRLAFEYQGGHHYSQTYRDSVTGQKKRDSEKRKMCEEVGISLVEVPYWWDLSTSSLISTIKRYRPDVQFKQVKQPK